ncbi:MAG: hypothetical protein ACI9B9_000702 [Halioglobus sp.]|jgi:hypothetical protein
MRTIQLTHIFLAKGYLIRGGVSIGKVWHTESNIIGPAYQGAYLVKLHPKLTLSGSVLSAI